MTRMVITSFAAKNISIIATELGTVFEVQNHYHQVTVTF